MDWNSSAKRGPDDSPPDKPPSKRRASPDYEVMPPAPHQQYDEVPSPWHSSQPIPPGPAFSSPLDGLSAILVMNGNSPSPHLGGGSAVDKDTVLMLPWMDPEAGNNALRNAIRDIFVTPPRPRRSTDEDAQIPVGAGSGNSLDTPICPSATPGITQPYHTPARSDEASAVPYDKDVRDELIAGSKRIKEASPGDAASHKKPKQ